MRNLNDLEAYLGTFTCEALSADCDVLIKPDGERLVLELRQGNLVVTDRILRDTESEGPRVGAAHARHLIENLKAKAASCA